MLGVAGAMALVLGVVPVGIYGGIAYSFPSAPRNGIRMALGAQNQTLTSILFATAAMTPSGVAVGCVAS